MKGGKTAKMIYTEDRSHGKTTEFVDVEPAEQRRFSLSDEDAEALARQAMTIEAHYVRPMDIEWGKDGETGKLYILQAHSET